MDDQKKQYPDIGGEITQTLQINVLTLTIKALVATHPNPQALERAMLDVFAQFQASKTFLALPLPVRGVAREMFHDMLQKPPETDQASGGP